MSLFCGDRLHRGLIHRQTQGCVAVLYCDDAPEIAGTGLTGSVTEDASLAVDGTAQASDLDGDDVTFSSSATGTHGSFSIDPDGTWLFDQRWGVDDAWDRMHDAMKEARTHFERAQPPAADKTEKRAPTY